MVAENNITNILRVEKEALAALESINDPEQLEEWRISYLGRRSTLTQILRALKDLSIDEKRKVGATANSVKGLLEEKLAYRDERLRNATVTSSLNDDRLDVTLPGWPMPSGRLHPTTLTIREICQAFSTMGFQVAEGPEVELDKYNFEMLNIPKDHPARDMFNTLWVDYTDSNGDKPILLRTHTSPMQARIMNTTEPPIRVVVPGRVFRYEATDATHEWHFHQVEGLAVDQGISMANLKGTLYEFARLLFGNERKVRFRCDYFPFVEPGVDMSIDCFSCSGKGCRICGKTGWIEIMGAGMVHPNVLESVGYDPLVYTGFAFGIGVERVAMLKHNIEDVRLFYSNELPFLKQF